MDEGRCCHGVPLGKKPRTEGSASLEGIMKSIMTSAMSTRSTASLVSIGDRTRMDTTSMRSTGSLVSNVDW